MTKVREFPDINPYCGIYAYIRVLLYACCYACMLCYLPVALNRATESAEDLIKGDVTDVCLSVLGHYLFIMSCCWIRNARKVSHVI